MKNLKLFSILLAMLLCVFFVTSCGAESAELSVESIYARAAEAGYTGTIDEFIAAFRGDDGLGIQSATVDSDNHLVITLDDGTTVDCGAITVRDGKDGSTVSIGKNGNWYVDGEDTGVSAKAQDGKDGKDGKDGRDGADGQDGASWLSGKGIPSSSQGKNGDLYLDSLNFSVYTKSGGAWELLGNFFAGDNENITVNEGDTYNVEVNASSAESEVYAAVKGLLSSVLIECDHAAGSGVIYKLDKSAGSAYIITNYHVVYDAQSTRRDNIANNINCYLYGYESSAFALEAEYVGGSMNYDIAVLRVENSATLRESSASAVELGSAASVRVLDTVIAIGNAEGYGISATRGAVNVDVESIELTGADDRTEISLYVFRIDAAVNAGNSGGGLFNATGKLVGIVNAKIVDEEVDNIGYAIPVDIAVAVAENVIATCNGSTVIAPQRVTLGITIQAGAGGTSFNAETGKLSRVENVTVAEVSAGSLADGVFEAGDVLKSITIDGTTYQVGRMYDITAALLWARSGSEVSFTVLRDNSETELSLVVPSAALGSIS